MKTLWGMMKVAMLLVVLYWIAAQMLGVVPLPGWGSSGGTAMTLPMGS